MPLLPVLLALGWDATAFKVWKQGQEFYGESPIHGRKKNNTAFSFHVDGRWNCFSCGKKGRGAIDLCMAVRSLGFQEAVATLRALDIVSLPAQAPTMRPTSTEIASEAATSENPPFAGHYHKYFVDSVWLRNADLSPGR